MKQKIILLVLAIISILVLSQYISKPFYGHHDWNSNIWTLTARNNIEHGLGCTWGGQSTTSIPISSCKQLRYYMNHPPLISWLVTLSYSVFGFVEWAGRLPIILVSTGSALLLYLLGKKLYDWRVGLLASGLMMATTMFQYFGKSMNHEPLIVMGMVWAVYAYVIWVESKGKRGFGWLIGSAVWMGLAGWHGYLIFGFLAMLTWIRNRKLFVKSLIPVGILVVIFGLHQLHTYWLTGWFNTALFSQFLRRINLGGPAAESDVVQFDYLKFFKQEQLWLRIYYSTFLVLGGAVFTFWRGWKVFSIKKLKLKIADGVMIVLLLSGAMVPLIFSQQAFIHDYLLMFVMPFLALSCAVIVFTILDRFKNRWLYVLPLVLIVLVAVEKRPFLQALFDRDAEKQYVDLAEFIKSQDDGNDTFLVESINYWEFAYPSVWNYAYGTHVEGRSDDLNTFMKDEELIGENFDYIIHVNSHPVSSELLSHFDEQWEATTSGDFTVFSLK